MAELTKAEKLLLAARQLDTSGRSEFTAEDLVVEAFKMFPRDFCLKGYPEYPDNNSILTSLMGKDARMIVTGWLEKTGTKKYRITTKGSYDSALKAQEFDKGNVEATTVARTERKIEHAFGDLFMSDAFEKFRTDDGEAITFHQFCRFIGLAAPDTWQKIQGKLRTAQHLVDEARKLGEAGQTLRLYHRGSNHVYAPNDLMSLTPLFEMLTRKFQPEMEAWERKLRR